MREHWTLRTRLSASTKEWSTRNTWIKSGQKQNNFPRSFSLGSRELPSAQYESLRTAETPSSRVLCERSHERFMICRTKNQKSCDYWLMVGIELRRAGCRWRVTKLALSITSWVLISTMATF